MRKCLPLVWGAVVYSLIMGYVEANEVDSLLLFGDSYFDTQAGNAVAESLAIPLPNPTPPYFDGRHSNGPNWADYTSQLLEIPYTNYAVSGSQTGSGNFAEPPLGGLFQQLDRFVANATSLTPINPETLVVVDGGGNDFFSLLTNPSLTPQAVIQQAILNLEHVFGELQVLGAKQTVMWSLGNMGMLPLFTDPAFGLTALSSTFTQITNAYNGALLSLIQNFNAVSTDKKQIYYFDANAVFQEISEELAAQGVNLTEHTITTVGGTYVVTGPQPEDLAFYDQVHPTTLVWQMFANSFAAYTDTLSEGPSFIGAEEDLAFESSRAHRDLLNNHFRTLHMQRYVLPSDYCDCCCYRCDTPDFQFYLDADIKWGSTNSRHGARGIYYDTQLMLLGLDYRWNESLIVGTAFTAQNNCARVHKNGGKIDLTDYIPTVYAFYDSCNYFIDADINYHFYDYRRIKRKIPFLDRHAKARVDGRGLEANIEVGHVKQTGCVTFIPLVGLSYQNLHIDDYREKHAGFLNLKVPTQHQNSLIGKIGAEMFWNFFHNCILPFAEVSYEHEFMRHKRELRPYFAESHDNSVIYNDIATPKLDYVKFAFGVDAKIADNLTGNVSYQGETTFTEYNNSIRLQFDTVF